MSIFSNGRMAVYLKNGYASGPKWGSAEKLHAIAAARSLDCTTSINRGPRARELPRELPRALPFQGVQEVRLVKVAVGIGQRFARDTISRPQAQDGIDAFPADAH